MPSTKGISGPGTTKSILFSTAQSTIFLKFVCDSSGIDIFLAFEAGDNVKPFPAQSLEREKRVKNE